MAAANHRKNAGYVITPKGRRWLAGARSLPQAGCVLTEKGKRWLAKAGISRGVGRG